MLGHFQPQLSRALLDPSSSPESILQSGETGDLCLQLGLWVYSATQGLPREMISIDKDVSHIRVADGLVLEALSTTQSDAPELALWFSDVGRGVTISGRNPASPLVLDLHSIVRLALFREHSDADFAYSPSERRSEIIESIAAATKLQSSTVRTLLSTQSWAY